VSTGSAAAEGRAATLFLELCVPNHMLFSLPTFLHYGPSFWAILVFHSSHCVSDSVNTSPTLCSLQIYLLTYLQYKFATTANTCMWYYRTTLPHNNAFKTLEETFATTKLYYKIHSQKLKHGYAAGVACVCAH